VRFKPGEALTSQELARLPSGAFDWLVTIDPHLHRCGSFMGCSRWSPCPSCTARGALVV